MEWTSVIIAFVLIGCSYGDISHDITNQLDSGIDALSKLPELDGLDLSQFNLTRDNLPTQEEAEKLFKDKCLKNADMQAFKRAQAARDTATECFKSLVNTTELAAEIETEKLTGNLDQVFKKYCQKSPTLLGCVSNFTSSIEACLDEEEKDSKHVAQNITNSLVNFACYKGGDRIALFFAEAGPECFEENMEGIRACVNETFGHYMPNSSFTPDVNNIPSLVLGVQECADIRSVQKCIVTKLETCSQPTPANIAESLFNFIYKSTPCAKITKDALKGDGSANGGDGIHESLVLFVSLLSLIAVKLV